MAVSEVRPASSDAIQSVQDRLIDTVTASQQGVLDAVQSTGRAMIEGVDLTRRSITDFVAERIRQDIDTQAALMRCRTLEELRAVQSRYLRKAVDQYADEAARLILLGRALAARSLDGSDA